MSIESSKKDPIKPFIYVPGTATTHSSTVMFVAIVRTTLRCKIHVACRLNLTGCLSSFGTLFLQLHYEKKRGNFLFL